MRRSMLCAAVTAVAGTFALAACGGDQGEPGLSTFDAAIAGAIAADVAGTAGFGILREAGSTGFTIVLEGGQNFRLALQTAALTRPFPASYMVVPKADAAGNLSRYYGRVDIVVEGVLQEFEVKSGTLVIVGSNPNQVNGTFSVQAVRTSPCCDPVPIQVVVQGNFSAIPVTQAPELPAP